MTLLEENNSLRRQVSQLLLRLKSPGIWYHRGWLAWAIVLLLLAGCTTTASESLPYTLAEGETQRGDLRVVGGNAALEAGSQLTGGVYMTHGNLLLGPHAVVGKDIVMLNGTLQMEPGAVVEGDVVMLSGRLSMLPDAAIQGELATGFARVMSEVITRLLRQVLLVVCLPVLMVAALIGLLAWWQHRKARQPHAIPGEIKP